MTVPGSISSFENVRLLLGGRVEDVRADLEGRLGRSVAFQLTLILLGAGLYGAAMGWWRSPLMAAYNFVKFPLVVLAATMGNALLNGMLAPLLGVDLRFRDSLRLVLMAPRVRTSPPGTAFGPVRSLRL